MNNLLDNPYNLLILKYLAILFNLFQYLPFFEIVFLQFIFSEIQINFFILSFKIFQIYLEMVEDICFESLLFHFIHYYYFFYTNGFH